VGAGVGEQVCVSRCERYVCALRACVCQCVKRREGCEKSV
jgi:hypothetical protein